MLKCDLTSISFECLVFRGEKDSCGPDGGHGGGHPVHRRYLARSAGALVGWGGPEPGLAKRSEDFIAAPNKFKKIIPRYARPRQGITNKFEVGKCCTSFVAWGYSFNCSYFPFSDK